MRCLAKRGWIPLSAAMALGFVALWGGSVAAQAEPQQANAVLNTPTEALSPGLQLLKPKGALLTRHPDRLVLDISMDVPTPATYVYPSTVPPERQASPEVFTLWVFIFNEPDACVSATPESACGALDFNEAARGGVYGVAGHVTALDHSGGAFQVDRDAGGRMHFLAEIAVGDPQRPNSPPDSVTFPLEDPMGAEVHVAIAPHGQMDPATIATELYEPAGGPTCACWWAAFFHPPGG